MRPYYLLIFLVGFMLACSQNSGKDQADKTSEKKIRKIAFAIAENYGRNQLKDPQKTTGNGFITLSDSQKRYIINLSKIYVGLIDGDSKKDAIVSIFSFKGKDLNLIEHLIIIKTNGKFMLIKAFESDMRILQLKDRVITAELPTKPRTSPLYGCPSCVEIVKYQYKDGDLVKIN
jgi:hypothetical protein